MLRLNRPTRSLIMSRAEAKRLREENVHEEAPAKENAPKKSKTETKNDEAPLSVLAARMVMGKYNVCEFPICMKEEAK